MNNKYTDNKKRISNVDANTVKKGGGDQNKSQLITHKIVCA